MIILPLQAIPNQSFSIQLDGNNWDVRVFSCNTTPLVPGTQVMAYTFILNGVVIINNQRGAINWPLIGYEYLENGNFYMITENDNYPDYTMFGITQYLIYASESEIQAVLNGN